MRRAERGKQGAFANAMSRTSIQYDMPPSRVWQTGRQYIDEADARGVLYAAEQNTHEAARQSRGTRFHVRTVLQYRAQYARPVQAWPPARPASKYRCDCRPLSGLELRCAQGSSWRDFINQDIYLTAAVASVVAPVELPHSITDFHQLPPDVLRLGSANCNFGSRCIHTSRWPQSTAAAAATASTDTPRKTPQDMSTARTQNSPNTASTPSARMPPPELVSSAPLSSSTFTPLLAKSS